MKKLLLLLALAVSGCMESGDAEKKALELAQAFCPDAGARTTFLGAGDVEGFLVAVTFPSRPTVLLNCHSWRCAVATRQIPVWSAEPPMNKEKK